jgi:hypothetical protein
MFKARSTYSVHISKCYLTTRLRLFGVDDVIVSFGLTAKLLIAAFHDREEKLPSLRVVKFDNIDFLLSFKPETNYSPVILRWPVVWSKVKGKIRPVCGLPGSHRLRT